MWERLRQFSSLESPAQKIFLRAAVLLPLISLSLRLRGFVATQNVLQKLLPVNAGKKEISMSEGAYAELSARMVRAAVRHGAGRPTCLEESLALWWLLGRRRIASQLRIGVKRDSPKFQAHAWVELAGEAINEPDELHHYYAAFDGEISPALPPENR